MLRDLQHLADCADTSRPSKHQWHDKPPNKSSQIVRQHPTQPGLVGGARLSTLRKKTVRMLRPTSQQMV